MARYPSGDDLPHTATVQLTGPSDSVHRRYAFKLGANVVALFGNAVTQLIVPRALGPVVFGQYSYLTNFFTQVVGFFDSGTSIGFFTKLSQRQQDRGLVRFYALLVGAVLLLLVTATAVAIGLNATPLLWPGQVTRYIWLALAFAWLTWVMQVVGQMLDAFGLTVSGELMRMVQKAVMALGLVALYLAGRVTLGSFFAFQLLTVVLLVALWTLVLRRHGRALVPATPLTRAESAAYGREMYAYAGPLAAMGVAMLLIGLLDRWLLQQFGGSSEQGFFGLSAQIGAVCFLFTSALTPIWMREMSVAQGLGDRAAVGAMFARYVPLLAGVAAFIAVFVAWQGQRIAALLGGVAFQGAGAAVAIMALYPVHQTYGQLSGSLLLVAGRTKLYRNIAISCALAGLPLTLWLLASPERGGLGLGATGLAIKMVGMQLLAVNVQLWFNARELEMPFLPLLGQQLGALLVPAALGGLAVVAANRATDALIPNLLVSGVLYTAGCAAVLILLPGAFGSSRETLRLAAQRVRETLGPGRA